MIKKMSGDIEKKPNRHYVFLNHRIENALRMTQGNTIPRGNRRRLVWHQTVMATSCINAQSGISTTKLAKSPEFPNPT